jgi:hypothetical protein
MLDQPNIKRLPLPDWVPQEFVRVSAISIRPADSFDAYGTLFDELYGEGEPGVFAAVLDDVRSDPQGPRVDLRSEIVMRLQPVAWQLLVNDSRGGPATVTGIPVREEADLARAVDRLFEGDDQAVMHEFDGSRLWELKPLEELEQTSLPQTATAVMVRSGFLFFADNLDVLKGLWPESAGSHAAIDDVLRAAGELSGGTAAVWSATRLNACGEMIFQAVREPDQNRAGPLIVRLLGRTLEAGDSGRLPAWNDVGAAVTGSMTSTVQATAEGWVIRIRIVE